mgnify:FL=1
MANIPANFGGYILTAGNSVTGSFAGIQSLGTGSATAPTGSVISAFRYGNGIAADGSVVDIAGVAFTIPAGVSVPLFITSCSLAAGSAPVILYT